VGFGKRRTTSIAGEAALRTAYLVTIQCFKNVFVESSFFFKKINGK
jgi:hypothetical protein